MISHNGASFEAIILWYNICYHQSKQIGHTYVAIYLTHDLQYRNFKDSRFNWIALTSKYAMSIGYEFASNEI